MKILLNTSHNFCTHITKFCTQIYILLKIRKNNAMLTNHQYFYQTKPIRASRFKQKASLQLEISSKCTTNKYYCCDYILAKIHISLPLTPNDSPGVNSMDMTELSTNVGIVMTTKLFRKLYSAVCFHSLIKSCIHDEVSTGLTRVLMLIID